MTRRLAWIRAVIATVALLIGSAPLAPTLSQALQDKQPNASLSPEAVVRIQMEALGRNDEPYADRGIEITWRFASPGNKVLTGPLERFKTMVRGPVYAPMLNYKSVKYENLQMLGARAQVDVIVRSRENRYFGYRFGLSRQDDPACDGCWMTDSVVPFEVTVS